MPTHLLIAFCKRHTCFHISEFQCKHFFGFTSQHLRCSIAQACWCSRQTSFDKLMLGLASNLFYHHDCWWNEMVPLFLDPRELLPHPSYGGNHAPKISMLLVRNKHGIEIDVFIIKFILKPIQTIASLSDIFLTMTRVSRDHFIKIEIWNIIMLM